MNDDILDHAQELIQIATNGRDAIEAMHYLATLASKFEKERDTNALKILELKRELQEARM